MTCSVLSLVVFLSFCIPPFPWRWCPWWWCWCCVCLCCVPENFLPLVLVWLFLWHHLWFDPAGVCVRPCGLPCSCVCPSVRACAHICMRACVLLCGCLLPGQYFYFQEVLPVLAAKHCIMQANAELHQSALAKQKARYGEEIARLQVLWLLSLPALHFHPHSFTYFTRFLFSPTCLGSTQRSWWKPSRLDTTST